MKKLLLSIIVLLVSSTCYAEPFKFEEVIQKMPNMKNGIAYSVTESTINYFNSFEVLKKGSLSLDVGYATPEEGHKLIGFVNFDLLSLKDFVEVPILNLIDVKPGVMVGISRIGGDNEFEWGFGLSILEIKF